jgi:hypothetical protein
MMFQNIFQRKSFKRRLRLSFQKDFQEDFERGEGLGGERELSSLYADLVENKLEVEGVPAQM